MDAYSAEGVDLTLVRWMLSLTPEERLDVLQDMADFLAEARVKPVSDAVFRNPEGAG